MNFSRSEVAALVLGYLKSERLHSVIEEFVKCSPYLKENNEKIIMGKYFVTRVAGMSLIDFLEQYSMIYAIVSGRLEDTDYYQMYPETNLVKQLLYLLDNVAINVATSTPVRNEVDTTPAHALPGNSSGVESDNSILHTPKKPNTRSRSKERDKEIEKVMEITEVFSQSLLENRLHEKIAENINIVRNISEVGKTVSDEHISAGASKELDAVIKTVIQRTEEDPVYNKLLDEIIGTAASDNKKQTPCNSTTPNTTTPTSHIDESSKSKSTEETPKTQTDTVPDPMIDHNNDAIRSIIEASQNPNPPPPPDPLPQVPVSKSDPSGEVYLFDGSLDTYLKTSGATTNVAPNPVYFNPGGLIVMQPPPETPKQFYIVNNQPVIKMNVLTEKELMSLPTIIVNDDNAAPIVSTPSIVSTPAVVSEPVIATPPVEKKLRRLRPVKPKVTKPVTEPLNVVVTEPPPTVTTENLLVTAPRQENKTNHSVLRQDPHIRNLDFSAPSNNQDEKTTEKKSNKRTWDEDLRQLITGCKDKSPSPKRRRHINNKKKNKRISTEVQEKEKETEEKEKEIEEKEKDVEEKENDVEEKENPGMLTPVKDMIPKTPGGMIESSFHCTPFNDVLEEQLMGVDLSSIPTPNLPITPGFALTPGEVLSTNQRLTDYSTSSSYYQPSDTEQAKTMCQLIEETKNFVEKSPNEEKLTILSDVVIQPSEVKKANEHLKKFNHSVVGKKNLSLIRHQTTSSSSSESESEEEEEPKISCKKDKRKNVSTIKKIIKDVKVKKTLDEESRKKDLLSHLEAVRQRTIEKIKNPEPKKRNYRRKTQNSGKNVKKTKKNNKKKDSPEATTDEEAQKLVKGLAQRGIHLIPNKVPVKKAKSEEEVIENEELFLFDKKTYGDCEIVIHDDKTLGKSTKDYDFEVLKKSMSAKVFVEELDEEVTRLIQWTLCETILDLENITQQRKVEDELMDFCVAGSLEESPDPKTDVKGRKKRKSKFEDDEKQKDKKNKTYENNLKLLKSTNVDVFLDQLYG